MRTDNPSYSAMALNRVRAQLSRARRLVLAQPPTVRWSLAGALLAAALAVTYLSLPVAPTYKALSSRFAPSDVARITDELVAKHIGYKIVDGDDRIFVDAAHFGEVQEILKALNLEDVSLSEIREKIAAKSTIFDNIGDKEHNEVLQSELELEKMIRDLDEIESAWVRINRSRRRIGETPAVAPNALVKIDTVRNRPISFKTVQSIIGFVTSRVPEIKHDAVAVYDRKGRSYLDATNPAGGQVSRIRIRAKEEELAEKILEKLDHIEGLRVTVQIATVPVQNAQPVPSQPAPHSEADSGSMVVANQPIKLEPEPRVALPLTAKPAGETELIRIWVTVPSSYYRQYLNAGAGHKGSPEELKPLVDRTETLIKTAVAYAIPVVPGQETPKVSIDTIPDGPLPEAPIASSNPSEPGRTPAWWIIAGAAIGATVLVSSILGYRVISSTRRPAPHFVTVQDRGRFKVDGASEPGPSERVRELIRLNPQAAASVLHRWTGQGGRVG